MILFINPLHSQEWIRIFGNGLVARWVIESYDKGYVIIGASSNYTKAYILKTDINGYELWHKAIGNGTYHHIPAQIEQTSDGGYIMCGTIGLYDYKDPYILKLNACFEKEWCKLLNTPGGEDYGEHIRVLKDEGYIFLTRYYGNNPIFERIHLHRFDQEGNLLWQHVYAQSDSLIFGEEGYDLQVLGEEGYLISGLCFYPDPGGTGGIQRPLFIKTDPNGNVLWELVYGISDYFYGRSRETVINNQGDYYSIGRNVKGHDKPNMYKISASGDPIFDVDLVPESKFGGASAFVFMEDSLFIVSVGYKDYGNVIHKKLIKFDTLGIKIDEIELPTLSNSIFPIQKTFDNKYITVGTNYENTWKIYAFKVNSGLEFDTLYTQPFVYDSLCPYTIISETIDIDCNIIVEVPVLNSFEDKSELKISPNPAYDHITISLPEYLTEQNNTGSLQITSFVYQFEGKQELRIYDVGANLLKSIIVLDEQKEVYINMSDLKPGLYLVSFLLNDQIITSQKFIIRH